MTQTELLSIIKLELGTSHRPLEIDDAGLLEIIKLRTLPTFSGFYPCFEVVDVCPTRDMVEQGNWGKFYVRSQLEVMSIAKVFRNENAVMFRNQFGNNISNIFDLQAFQDAISAVYTPDTWSWIPPCTIELFPKYYNTDNFLVIAKCVHPDHLQTLPKEGLRDEFIKLALADVKIALYPIRKRFASVNSTYGNIELDLEIVENGKQEREDLLEKWRVQFHKEPQRKKMYIY